MSDTRTRRLIVTLPEATRGQASDAFDPVLLAAAESVPGAKVAHALDGAPLEGGEVAIRPNNAWRGLVLLQHRHHRLDLTIDQARKVAALLLRAADEVESGDLS